MLSYFGEINAPCRTSEVAEHLGVSAYQARHYLQCLEKEGKIKRSPVRRGASTLWEI
ncbi:TPA: F1845 fimbrial adhesin operon transcriptional regulator DaaF, partial [Escherichia coli]|nr:F1845 fimbrial adhesin operon transcriptional regulator DaaF [Escherichia coli]